MSNETPEPVEETQGSEGAGAQPEQAATDSSAELEHLRAERDAARRRVDELARAVQSLMADKDEFKQRLQRERERMIDVEKGNVAVTLLEAIDELDRSLQAAVSSGDDSPLARGVKLIRDGLLKKVEAIGIKRLELEGKPYDPNAAEATDMEVTADPDLDQKVVAVARAGYELNGRVIRPARVKVAKYVKPADA